AEDGIRDFHVTGVQTCALPIYYHSSYPAYDRAQDIYTVMLDDLKIISDELRTISLSPAMAERFSTQDVINGGDVDLWEKYCNSQIGRASCRERWKISVMERGFI